jgi:phospholipid transport system substrate-binding protein
MKKATYLILFLALLLPSAALAGGPTEELRESVDAVIDVLKDKELKKPENTKKRRAGIRKIVNGRFDFEEMAKRSLALHWQKRTPEEKKEFVPLYSDLLERTYIDKIEKYQDEKVLYVGELAEGEHATVKTKIITGKDVEIPISYKLFKKADGWKVYDVIIEGVSLVQNYRTQFNSIIRSDSYQELVKRLRDKVGERGE